MSTLFIQKSIYILIEDTTKKEMKGSENPVSLQIYVCQGIKLTFDMCLLLF